MKHTTIKFPNRPRGGDIWFDIARNAEGDIVGLEEHDTYQGGPITPRDGDYAKLLLERLEARGAPEVAIAQAIALISA